MLERVAPFYGEITVGLVHKSLFSSPRLKIGFGNQLRLLEHNIKNAYILFMFQKQNEKKKHLETCYSILKNFNVVFMPCSKHVFGTFWNILEHFRTFRNILVRVETCFGTFWNILKHDLKHDLEHFGTFWNIFPVSFK